MIYFLLFIEFAKISLVCVGGGYASMPLIQASVVDSYHWLTLPEFIDIFTISQMTPGPIGINAATFAGMKVAGIGGAIAATMGRHENNQRKDNRHAFIIFVYPSFKNYV